MLIIFYSFFQIQVEYLNVTFPYREKQLLLYKEKKKKKKKKKKN